MIKVQLALEESHFEHRSSNLSNSGENVAHAQSSVTQEENEIQNSNFEFESSKHPSEDNEEDDRKPGAKRIKQEPEDKPLRWTQEEQTDEPHQSPGQTRRTIKQYSQNLFLLEKTAKKIMI